MNDTIAAGIRRQIGVLNAYARDLARQTNTTGNLRGGFALRQIALDLEKIAQRAEAMTMADPDAALRDLDDGA